MRTLCDACESAAAVLFCAADEASLCRTCDDKIHMCNKFASRHVRIGLADPIDVPRCDICENTPAFFYCEIDGSSLCLQCDMAVHVGVSGDNVGHAKDLTLQLMGEDENKMGQNQSTKPTSVENQKNHMISPDPISNTSAHEHAKRGTNVFDLNMRPHKIHGEASNYQEP